MLENRYKIEITVPKLKIKIDDMINFVVVKTPVLKLTNFYILHVLLPIDTYHSLLDEFLTLRKDNAYLLCYLSIYLRSNYYSCDLTRTIKRDKEEVIYKNKPLALLKVRSLTDTSHKGDFKYVLTQIILACPNALRLKRDRSLSSTYYASSAYDIIKKFEDIILSKYNIFPYERIDVNKHKYDLLFVNNEISLLELPYYLQIYYKLSNKIPIFFYDDFSSLTFFIKSNAYKMYSYSDLNSLLKFDLTKYPHFTFSIIKEDNLDMERFGKFIGIPATVVFVKNDGDVIEKKITDNIKNEDIKEEKEGEYTFSFKEIENTFILNLHTPDTPENALERYMFTKKFFSIVQKVMRIDIYDVDFRLFDIGIAYKINKGSKYNAIFHNLAYNFIKDKTMDNTMRCDIIADMFLLDV